MTEPITLNYRLMKQEYDSFCAQAGASASHWDGMIARIDAVLGSMAVQLQQNLANEVMVKNGLVDLTRILELRKQVLADRVSTLR